MTKTELKRMAKLENDAINKCLDKMDFNPTDWMYDAKQRKEYVRLLKKQEKEDCRAMEVFPN